MEHDIDLAKRVIYALLNPAARLSHKLEIGLRPLRDLLEMAQFHEAANAGLRIAEIATLLEVSPRKAAQLSKRLKQNFLDPDKEVGLPRRIEFLLWAAPQSRARIGQALPHVEAEEVDLALSKLLDQGRVRAIDQGRRIVYERAQDNVRLVSEDWKSRIDALQNLLDNLADVVFARFFRDDKKAFARTISVRMRAEDLDELQTLYEGIWKGVTALEDNAREDPNALQINLSVTWAPVQGLSTGA